MIKWILYWDKKEFRWKNFAVLNFYKLTKQTKRTGVTKVQTRLLVNETQQLLEMKGEVLSQGNVNVIACHQRLSGGYKNTDRFTAKKGCYQAVSLHYL